MSKRAMEKKLKAKQAAMEAQKAQKAVEREAKAAAKAEQDDKQMARFIELLAALNNETVEILETGDLSPLYEMNDVVEEMFSIQHGNEDELYQGIDGEAKVIYGSFNALVRLTEQVGENEWTEEQSETARKLLENILHANLKIVAAYGLTE